MQSNVRIDCDAKDDYRVGVQEANSNLGNLNLRNRWIKTLCWTGLAAAFAVAPGTWAVSPAVAQNSTMKMSAQRSRMGGIDINTATESQLTAIPGMGPVYAKRIIENRPYRSKNQLVSKGVLPQSVYDKIKAQIVAHRGKK